MTLYNVLQDDDNHLVIFGAGFVGRYVLKKLKKKNVFVDAFCDNVLGRDDNEILGVPVYDLEKLNKKFGSKIRFIISVIDIGSIVMQLEKNGRFCWNSIPDVYELKDIEASMGYSFMEKQKLEAAWYYHMHFTDKENMYLDTLDLVITERCSLRCKECSNLMQYYAHPQNIDIKKIKEDIDRILSIYREIYELRLIGGEPFMHPGLAEIVAYLNEKNAVKRICIYTNATIKPTDEQLSVMKDTGKTWFSISNYGKLSRNIDAILSLLDKNSIGYEKKDVDYWTRCASFVKHNRTSNELEKIYYECCAKNLVTMLKGRLYPCPFIANAINLGAIPENTHDFVDVMDALIDRAISRKTRKCLNNRRYYESCDYCLGRPAVAFVQENDKIVPCEQAASVLSYDRETVS